MEGSTMDDHVSPLLDRLQIAVGFRLHSAEVPDDTWPAPPRPIRVVVLWIVLDDGYRPWSVRLPLPGSPSASPWSGEELPPTAWAPRVVTWLEAQVAANFPRWAAFAHDGVVRHLSIDATGLVRGGPTSW